jgi:transcriptional regulator with GAF, ATPase, and Fis domain
VSLAKSSSSNNGLAHELLGVQPVNGFHQDLKLQSTINSNGSAIDRGDIPARYTRPEAFSSIISVSRVMSEIIDKIERSRDSSAPMLITGETGTGKELIAHAVHDVSPRRVREFIPFNCGDATPELIASELFGHRRGTFTGADRDRNGVIREADGCTLFLDEIGELPLIAQPKLLRFLQGGEIRPVGDARPIKVNVRVIAATNRDLEADVRAGRFRSDLYYRLNVFRIHLPPLRERREDILPLIEHFLALRRGETGKQRLRLNDEALALLIDYHWPGNVREMQSLSHRLVASAVSDEVIGPERFLDEVKECVWSPTSEIIENRIAIDSRLPYHQAKDELERLFIINALNVTGGNISQAATKLGISLFGLRKAIKRLGIKWQLSCHSPTTQLLPGANHSRSFG